MQSTITLKYCRARITLFSWEQNKRFGVGNFDFLFCSSSICVFYGQVFDVFVTGRNVYWSVRSVSMVRLLFGSWLCLMGGKMQRNLNTSYVYSASLRGCRRAGTARPSNPHRLRSRRKSRLPSTVSSFST